jgi:hypothetical protein
VPFGLVLISTLVFSIWIDLIHTHDVEITIPDFAILEQNVRILK